MEWYLYVYPGSKYGEEYQQAWSYVFVFIFKKTFANKVIQPGDKRTSEWEKSGKKKATEGKPDF